MYQGKLVSGSKDKIIKLWNVSSNQEDASLIAQINNPHQTNHISCLLGNKYFDGFQSASNEGTVKLWTLDHDYRLRCKDTISVSDDNIEAQCWLDEYNGTFLCGSGDKKIRIYSKDSSSL